MAAYSSGRVIRCNDPGRSTCSCWCWSRYNSACKCRHYDTDHCNTGPLKHQHRTLTFAVCHWTLTK